ncbi:MAG: prepilin-type N-terminal cleavage/methylation domain-containing protein [Candidatus Omnitrophica bacterium]|nr:prepilin-type N-terminal cleavage/methylation domain-containing protein [Candidatus Omnitrophota bacterium]
MKSRAYTLIEIMLVTSIILLMAAIAIPNLLRARMNSNETVAMNSLKAAADAAVMFRASNIAYPPDLGTLATVYPPYIDSSLGSGSKSGYDFTFSGSTNTFTATARPQSFRSSGIRSFFVDESGVIRFTDQDFPATSADNIVE